MSDLNEEESTKQKYEIEGQGKQLNYEDYLVYKEDFNDARTVSYSSSDLYRKRKAERDKAIFDTLLFGSAAVGVGSLLYNQVNRDENIRSLLAELPSARLAKTKLTKQLLDNKAAGIIFDSIDPRSSHIPTVGASLHSMLLGLEELSPAQLLKTLQLYSFSSLFVEMFENRKDEIRHISEASIRTYGDYYRNLIKKESKIDLTDTDLRHGFILENNQLFSARQITDDAGKVTYQKKDLLLKHAQIITSGITTINNNGERAVSSNRIFEKLANQYDVNINRMQIEREPFVIVGSNQKNGVLKNWARAYGAFSVELGAKSLDNPLGFLEEYINLSGTGSKVFSSNIWKTAKRYSNIQLGAGGVYTGGSKDMLLRTGKSLAKKGAIATIGYYGLEGLIDSIAPEDSVWSNGIAAGVSATFMQAHVKFAEIWSDNFQRLKEKQEQMAPGSTHLSTLIGLPLAGAMMGANISYFKRMAEGTTKGIDGASARALDERAIGGKIGEFLDLIGKNAPTTSLGRNAKIGTVIGAAIALPFLPGALVGKSSEELKAEYSGEKKVAVRQTRHWLMGGGAFEGGKIEYHRDNFLRTIATDAKNKTLYGDAKTKRDLNPIFNPIAYLNNPYRFEEMHTHDMPMPVWGMDVSYGSFFGQMYKGTIGQIIKPSRVNQALLEDQRHLLTPLGGLNDTDYSDEANREATPQSLGKASPIRALFAEGFHKMEELKGQNINIDSDAYITPEHEKKEVKSLIADGLMLRANAPTNEPFQKGFQGAWSASEEFIGLKGFTLGLSIGASGYHPIEQLRPELEVSGSSTNFSKTILDAQLGDLLGCFLPGTIVNTKRGLIPIEEVTTKDKVLSLNHKYKRVRKVFTKSFQDITVVRLYVSGLETPILCTPDHVFPSIKIDTLLREDRPLHQIEIGDFLFKVSRDFNKSCFFKHYPYDLGKVIRKEVRVYSGNVYDLQVEDTPYYTVEGVFCHNSGEYLRRLFPQSASSKRETINPMQNLVTPSWMPSNETKYYKNFSRGSFYSHTTNGEYLLPGSKGFEELNPELKGVNPEDYPLVYQYSILQNVARNSPEHLAIKEHLIRNIDSMTDKEKDVFFEAYGQDEARDQLKKFNEYATEEEKEGAGIFTFHNALWEFVSHKENPLEPLLPFRPMAKFVHQRTAEEDYYKTQVLGPDTGIWTNPYSHFIKPAANRTRAIGEKGFLSEEYVEKNRVDQYFDKLSLIKADKNGDQYAKERNITTLAYTGVRNAEDMRRFKMALDSEQRAYIESFSRIKDKEKRERILQMLPNDVGRVYQSIWKNMDLYDHAVQKGIDPKKLMDAEYLKDTKKLSSIANVTLSRDEKKALRGEKYSLAQRAGFDEEYNLKEARAIRLKAAIKDAEQYVKTQTGGLPNDEWIGWDPRLKMDDIKLKTLMIGKEDIHKYGFWHQDVERIERLVGLTNTSPIVNDLEQIKREKKDQTARELTLKRKLRESGFEVSRITSSPSSKGSLTIKDSTEYLDNYYSQ